jgi:hypothetical protein
VITVENRILPALESRVVKVIRDGTGRALVEIVPEGGTFRAQGRLVELLDGDPFGAEPLMATNLDDAVAEARKLIGDRLAALRIDFLGGA